MKFNEGMYSVIVMLTIHFSRVFRIQLVFWIKYIVRRVMELHESWTLCFFLSIPTIKYYRTY